MSVYSILKGAGKFISEDASKGYSTLGKFLVKEIKPEQAEGYAQKFLGMQLTKGAKIATVGVAFAIPAIGTGMTAHHTTAIGKISAGEGLSSMTSSVELSPVIKKMQDGKHVKFRNSGANYGADGDIVFSLHNLR